MKTCTKCKVEQPFTSFHKQKSLRDGLKTYCKTCSAEYGAEHYRNNREARAAQNAKIYLNNKEARAAQQVERLADPEKHLRHRALNSFNDALRRATKYNDGVSPVISAEEKELMIQFLIAVRTLTETTGIEFDVDHIIPISKGGEHRLANLQCILKTDNLAKHDKLDFTDYTQTPSYPRPEDIAACQQTTPSEVAA